MNGRLSEKRILARFMAVALAVAMTMAFTFVPSAIVSVFHTPRLAGTALATVATVSSKTQTIITFSCLIVIQI